MGRILQGLSRTIDLSGVVLKASKNAVLTTGKLSINKTSEIAGKIARAVGDKAGGLASATPVSYTHLTLPTIYSV